MFEKLYKAGKLAIPDEDTAATLFEITQEICEQHGRPSYEISNSVAAVSSSGIASLPAL
jgi:coproporphyrinogen III oxidase-like Fe-S oxidoreductase